MGFLSDLRARLAPPYDDTRGLTSEMVEEFGPARDLLKGLVNASQGMRFVQDNLAYYRWNVEAPTSRFTYHVGHSGYPKLDKPWLAYAEEVDTLPGLPLAEMSGHQLSFRQERFATPVEAVVGFAKFLQQDQTRAVFLTDLLRTSKIRVSPEQLSRLTSLQDDLTVS